MKTDAELSLRISVRHPPRGVAFAVQRGREALLAPSVQTPEVLVFDFTVRIGEAPAGTSPRFLGPYTQGPPAARFVYVNAGQSAGQHESCWRRRAKIPLGGITAVSIQAATRTSGGRLETEFHGTGPDGGPTCATVKSIRWRVATDGGPRRAASRAQPGGKL